MLFYSFAAYKGPNIANAVSRRSSNAGNAAAATKTMKPPETNEDVRISVCYSFSVTLSDSK